MKKNETRKPSSLDAILSDANNKAKLQENAAVKNKEKESAIAER